MAVRGDISWPPMGSFSWPPSDWELQQELGLLPDPSAPASEWNRDIKGRIEGVNIIQWWGIPDKVALIVDIDQLCVVYKRSPSNGLEARPSVNIDPIDQDKAQRYIDNGSTETAQELMTRVKIKGSGVVGFDLKSAEAARWIPLTDDAGIRDQEGQ